jgi:hypothetical protein
MLVLGVALSNSAGCAGNASARDPQAALHQYAAALRNGDAETAYALLSEQAKSRMTFEAFHRILKEKPEDLRPLADALSRPGKDVSVTAVVTSEDGETLEMVYEDGAWKADISALHLYSQATPLRALGSFVRAFEAGRYDVLLRFAPAAHGDGLSQELLQKAWEGEQKQEMSQLVASLREALPTAEAEVIGDRATVGYGAAGTVQMLLEDGVWKIEEF